MGAALEVLVGPQAKGLSASTVSRLKQVVERLDKDHWVYVWADGVSLSIEDGVRESTQSWREETS